MSIIAAFEKATAQDLKDIQEKISSIATELEVLRSLERVLSKKFPDDSAKSEKPAEGSPFSVAEKRLRIAKFLLANGVKSMQALSVGTKLSRFGPNSLGQIVRNHHWFHVNGDDVVALTSAGETAAKREVVA